jgi:hypothetical protein
VFGSGQSLWHGLNFWNGPSRITCGTRNLLGFERTRVLGACSKSTLGEPD